MSAPAIVLRNVTKGFGNTVAVDDVSLEVPKGSIYGFIGPNGSGKTTTLRMIMHILLPDRGAIEVLGLSDARAARDQVGYLPEERGLYKKMTVRRLSDRVRRDDLFAFVEIPPDTLTAGSTAAVGYYSSQPTYQPLPLWLETTINGAVRAQRFKALKVDQAGMDAALREVPFRQLGLLERDAQGRIRPATEVDRFRSFGAAIGLPILLFMFVMTTAPQLLNAVIEETMSRIAEVMLGSVTPSELMWGKLLATAGAAIVLAVVYLGGAAVALGYLGYGDMLAPRIVGWFAVFLLLTLLIFGALFLAIGAACTDLRDAQTMMTPAMMIAVIPYVLVFSVVQSPDTTLSAGLSLIPFFTPFLMLVRLALEPGPPLWQLLLSVVLTVATAAGVVWAAGRIFRVGLLVQGKSATFREMLHWVRAA
ncbi:MAG: ATP-binding cassette domain-containing protein [Luteitalea sp.]|nr:ATP-binding cassette domain-containing protein [Luteitalea sp.]